MYMSRTLKGLCKSLADCWGNCLLVALSSETFGSVVEVVKVRKLTDSRVDILDGLA